MEALVGQSVPALLLFCMYALIDKVIAPLVKGRRVHLKDGPLPTPPTPDNYLDRLHAQEISCAACRAEVMTTLKSLGGEVKGTRLDLQHLRDLIMKNFGPTSSQ